MQGLLENGYIKTKPLFIYIPLFIIVLSIFTLF